MTLNENILRGNMHEMPELDNHGYSGVYRHNAKTGETTLGKIVLSTTSCGELIFKSTRIW